MTVRDTLAEAKSWLEHMRPERQSLKEALEDVSETSLILAYHLWWSTYTSGVRNSPTVNRPEGISEKDARAAGQKADDAVWLFLKNLEEAQ